MSRGGKLKHIEYVTRNGFSSYDAVHSKVNRNNTKPQTVRKIFVLQFTGERDGLEHHKRMPGYAKLLPQL